MLGVDATEEEPTSAQGSPDENSNEVDKLSTSGCFSGSETLSEADCNKGNSILCLVSITTFNLIYFVRPKIMKGS